MKRFAVGLLMGLAACGARAPEPVAVPAPSFRQAGTLIGSTARGGPADLGGEWVVSQAYPGGEPAAPGTRVIIEPGAGGALWRFASGGGRQDLTTTLVAPGRYAAGTDVELWVLWVDDDFRTAVVGTPDGSFGWIMDRPGQASADRTRAAREMLDFNGYDVGRLAG